MLVPVAAVPNLIGGSADLAPSNNTAMVHGDFTVDNRCGRTLHFGVREHAMGAIMSGLSLHGGIRPYGGFDPVSTMYFHCYASCSNAI